LLKRATRALVAAHVVTRSDQQQFKIHPVPYNPGANPLMHLLPNVIKKIDIYGSNVQVGEIRLYPEPVIWRQETVAQAQTS